MPATSGLLQEGRYRIDHSIAENTGSSIYQAYDTVRDTKVVVKEIVVRLNKVTTLSQQESLKLAFTNQAQMLSAIRHDSLVQVQDYFSEVGRQYLVLESLEGDDLLSLLEQNKRPFSLREVTAWAEQLLDGLHYLHSLETPIIHKFVRPQNVRLLMDGKVKLLAHGSSDGASDLNTNIALESNDQTVLNYSPLELIWEGLDSASQKVIVSNYDDRSEKILLSPADARSDIYSFGATLYHLLSGRRPVDPLERSIEMLEGNADPLNSLNEIDPNIPVEISDVVKRAMEIRREARFDSAIIMRQVLRTAVVRVHESEDDEARELREAAEDLRFAEKVRHDQIQTLVEQKARELEAEKRRQADELEQKLREVEELRLAAELRAAEAERLLQKQQAQRSEAEVTAKPAVVNTAREENLLEIDLDVRASVKPTPPAVETKAQTFKAEAAAEPEVVAFEESPVVSIHEFADAVPAKMDVSADHAPVVLPIGVDPELTNGKEADIAVATELAEKNDDVSLSTITSFSFEQTAGSGSKLSMPLVAGVTAVFLVLAAAGYFMFAGSDAAPSDTPAAVQSTSQAVTAPPAVETQPEVQTAVPTETADETTLNSAQADPAETQEPSKAAAKPKPAKPTGGPAKEPEKKKAVTVDDLINDN